MIQFEYNCSKSEKIFFDMKRIYDSPGHKSKVLEDGNDDNTCITGSSTSIANWLVSECGQKNSQLPLAQSASAKRHKELKSFRKKIEQDHPIRIQHPKSTGFPVISQSDACELLQFDNLPSRLHTIVRCIYGILTTYYSIVVHPILVHYELDCSVEDDCLSEKEKERYREMMSTHWPVSPMDRKRLLKFWESFAQHKDQRRINLKNSLSEFNWLIFRDDLISAGTCGKELALVLNVIIMDREYPKAGFPRAIYRALLRPIEGGLFSCDVSLCRLRIERKYLSWLVHAFEHIQQGLVLAQQLACGESTVQRQQSMSTKVIKKAAVSRTVFVAVDTIVSVPNCQESDSCECFSESCIWINMLLFALSVCHPYDCLNVLYLSDTHDGPCLSSGGSKSPTRDGIGSFSPPASPAKASRPSSQSSPLIRNSWDVSWKTLPAKTLRKSKTASICCASMFVDNGESSSPQSGTISSAGTASPTGRKRRRRKQAWDKVVFALSRRYGDAPQYSLKEMQRPVSTTARHTACDHQCAAECVAGSGKECGVGTPSLVSEEDEDSRRPHRSLFEIDIMDKIFAPALALHRQECRRRKACGRTSSASDDTPLVVLTDNTILGESGCTMNSERYGAEQIFSAVSSLLTAGCNVAVACLPMRVNAARTFVVVIPEYNGSLCVAYEFTKQLMKLCDTMILLHISYNSSHVPCNMKQQSPTSELLQGDSKKKCATSFLTESDIVKLYKSQGYNVKIVEVQKGAALSPVARLVVEAAKYSPDILVCDAQARLSLENMVEGISIPGDCDISPPIIYNSDSDCLQSDELLHVPVERSILEMALSSRLSVIMLK